MNILFAAAEAAPFAKKGGLADVVGSLPWALCRLGVDARVMMPMYGMIDTHKYAISHLFTFPFTRRTGTTDVSVFTTRYQGVTYYFVRGWPFFGQEREIYSAPDWDISRFLFFNQVALAAAWEIKQRIGWFPDLFHVNDWHTSLIPFLIDLLSQANPAWQRVGSVLSLHNAGRAYQQPNIGGWLWELGIPARTHPGLMYHDLTDNMLGIGIAYADKIVAVSPRYSIEIHYPYMSGDLAGLIYARTDDVHGILNGIDVNYWNPDTDQFIVSAYNADNFPEHRPPNKRQLQAQTGLKISDDTPIVGIVSRMVPQKGFDLAIEPLNILLQDTDTQLILLGLDDPQAEALRQGKPREKVIQQGKLDFDYYFWRMVQAFPGKVAAYNGFNEPLAHRIYAGCDLFLMPSRYEPCGLGQMNAMRYGSLPVARETGGLADTVENYDNGPADRGTGFVFNWEQSDAVLNTLRWALDTYRNQPEAWQRMQRRAMSMDFSWDKSARQYVDLYQEVIQKRKGGEAK